MLTHLHLHKPHSVVRHNRIAGVAIPSIAAFTFTCIDMLGTWGSPDQARYLPQWVMMLLWNTPSILMLLGMGLVVYGAYLYRSWWGLLVIPLAVTASVIAAVLLLFLPGGGINPLSLEWDIMIVMVIAPALIGTAAGIGMAQGSSALRQHYAKKERR